MNAELLKVRHEEQEAISNYQLADIHEQTIENYTFTVNSFFPEVPAPSATEILCGAIKPKVIGTLAKSNPYVVPSSSKCHANNAAGRR